VAVLRIGGTDYGQGAGRSKKEAEQEAAADAWRKLSAPGTAGLPAESEAGL
jgi:ribonuclease-3